MMEKVNSSMIYLIYCKNFLYPQHNNRKKEGGGGGREGRIMEI
jgi:hypothetical protein